MWSSDGISPEGETLTLKLASVKKVSQVRLTFDSNFNYPIKITLSKKRQLQQIGVPRIGKRLHCDTLAGRNRRWQNRK